MLSNSKYVYTLTKLPSSFYSFLFDASVFDGIKLASSDIFASSVLRVSCHVAAWKILYVDEWSNRPRL